MANQRSNKKRSVGVYLDVTLKRRMTAITTDQTQFVEFAVIRSLLKRREISPKEIRTLHDQGRIKPETFLQLRRARLV